MPVTDPIDLQKFQQYAQPLVESGHYANANEVLTAAMEALSRKQFEDAKLAELKLAVNAGFASGVVEGDVFARVRAQAGLPVLTAH